MSKFSINLIQELRDQVGNTVAAGVDFTGQIARVAVPVVQAAAQSVGGVAK